MEEATGGAGTMVAHPAPLPKEVDAGAAALLEQGLALPVIEKPDQYQAAGELVVKIREERKQVKDKIVAHYKEAKESAHRTHKNICDMERKEIDAHDARLAEMESLLLRLREAYEKAVKEAQEKAAAEEKARREAEDKLKAEQEAARLKEFEDQKIEAAAALEADGKIELAEHVLETPPPPPEPVFTAPAYASPAATMALFAPKTAGLSKRDNWEPVYKDKVALIKAAAANPDAYAGYLTFNEKALETLAKSLKAEARCPGVEFVNNPTDVINTKRKGK